MSSHEANTNSWKRIRRKPYTEYEIKIVSRESCPEKTSFHFELDSKFEVKVQIQSVKNEEQKTNERAEGGTEAEYSNYQENFDRKPGIVTLKTSCPQCELLHSSESALETPLVCNTSQTEADVLLDTNEQLSFSHSRCDREDKQTQTLSDDDDDTDDIPLEHSEATVMSVMELFNRLHLQDRTKTKLTSAEFLQIVPTVKHETELCESDLCYVYLHKLIMLDYRARYIQAKQERENVSTNEQTEMEDFFDITESTDSNSDQIHPLDVQMALFHCSDSFLKQKMITKLSQCQYALPLLVPDPFTGDIECPLWTFRQIKKTWKTTEVKDSKSVVTTKSMFICEAETPMVLCFRLGSLSVSKSQVINTLINDRHSTFFHRNCPVSTKNRVLFDGVAEIAWYSPAGKHNDSFTDCVAFCNLHGDGLIYKKQLDILMDKAAVCVVFVPTLDREHKSAEVIKSLLESQKPVIVLIENKGTDSVQHKGLKYRMGLKDRRQPDVSDKLRRIIRDILSAPHKSFQLESLSDSELRVDEHDTDCSQSKCLAKEMMNIIESVAVADVKKMFLPCQGQLWHDWSKVKKELYRLKGDLNLESEKAERLNICKKLREDQCKASCGELMKSFVQHLSSLNPTQREYFLKWAQLLLDDYTTNHRRSILQWYDQKWCEVLDLKKRSEDSHNNPSERSNELKLKQAELSQISQTLQSLACGLEHLFREMGQIYEAHKSLDKPPGQELTDWSKYPELAAELMISGHPMELMDGDASHVPLTWIKSLIDHVIYKLGNKRVFVLSVLGEQNSGKSTMLNAMFGLQFSLSAERCTRGVFMQLMKLSEDSEDFQWEYILVVDTEGLRALELEGNASVHHDNELATFVVGLGNMTIVNIFGDNPSQMVDVLQIVVQDFMRMKKVKLTPSCLFVCQNVTDVSVTEKNIDDRRKLQDKLDQMVKLAAKEEVCDAERFSDIIDFDAQKDVRYFAQLWEGSPPMAPQNPGYSESVQDLKNFILSKAKKSSGITLSQFRGKVEDLWNAILSENFVFSFKNTLEIEVYRKLEVQFSNWTWTLRSEILNVEEQLYIRIINGDLGYVDLRVLHHKLDRKYTEIKLLMTEYFEREEYKEMLIQWRSQHECKIKDFMHKLLLELQKKLNNVIDQKKSCLALEEKKAVFESNLLQKSKELALRRSSHNDHELEKQFNQVWQSWVSELTQGTKPVEKISLENDQIMVIKEFGFEMDLIMERKQQQNYKTLFECGDCSDYLPKKHNDIFLNKIGTFFTGRLPHKNQEQIKHFIKAVEKQVSEQIKNKPIAQRGYSSSYLREMIHTVITSSVEFESQWNYRLKKEFKVDLILFVFDRTARWISDSHSQFIKYNDVRVYLESKKNEYFSVFKSFFKGSSSSVVLAEMICDKLRTSMTEAVSNKTAINVADDMMCSVPAFRENRLNLEKYILKSLAEKRDFQRYTAYIRDPKTYTETFIRETVEHLLQTEYKDKCSAFHRRNISNIKQQVLYALDEASEKTKEVYEDRNMWLQTFTRAIARELVFESVNPEYFKHVIDFDFLKEQIDQRLKSICADLSVKSIKWFRHRPEQLLIDQLCNCCWEKCPFCAAVCTNSMKDHTSYGADHSTPFHRSRSISGGHNRGSVEMLLPFCTSEVAGDGYFDPSKYSTWSVSLKSYRAAGPPYDRWCIIPDFHEQSYWKWVVCTFQTDLEIFYNLKYTGRGTIPSDWRRITYEQAIKSLEEMYR